MPESHLVANSLTLAFLFNILVGGMIETGSHVA